MARQANDIVQRLTLNGAQFASETDRLFGQMESGARASASTLKQEFSDAYRQIEQLAKRAVSTPVGATGALNIDPAAARASAQAAEAEAQAARELATAVERVAKQKGNLSERDAAYVMGTRAAAEAAEAHARALGQQANFLDLVQLELNQTGSAVDNVVAKNRLLNASTRGTGMAAVQSSQQVQDFFIQVQGGQSILVAATQQLSQLGIVLHSAEGAAGKFGRFLAGGWGSLIFVGLAVVSLFASKIAEAGDELAKETKELEKNAQKTRVAAAAKEAYSRTADGLIAKIREEYTEMEKLNRTMMQTMGLRYSQQRQATRDTEKAITKNVTDLSKAYDELSKAEAKVAKLDARAAREQGNTGEAARGQLAAARSELARIQSAVKNLERQQSELQTSIRQSREMEGNIRADAIDNRVTTARDAEKAATDRLTDSLKLLRQEYIKVEAGKPRMTNTEYERRQQKLRDDSKAEIDRIRARDKAERDSGKAEQRMRLLDPVSGGRVTSGLGARTAPKAGASSNHRGIDIAVPVGTGVRAGGAGVVVSVGNMGKLGKAVIVDYGDKVIATYGHLSETLVSKGQAVSPGQMIARSGNTGNSTGPHLHYGVTKDGRPIDPRRASVREGAGDKAAAELAREAEQLRKREADQRDRVLAASQKQLDVEAESLRFLGLRVRGLDEQAQAEADIARKQREHHERMADLSAADRAEQAKMHPMLSASLSVFRAQAGVYADLVEKAGDQVNLTDDQRKALDDANAAMLTQLDAARALAKTAEDRFQIEAAIARVQARIATSQGKGEDRAKADKRAAEDLARDMENQDRERAERQRDQIYSLANFYRDAFQSGTGGIVENFKEEMLDVISEVAARWTIALLSGQKTSLGSILGEMGATSGVGGGGLLGGLLGALGGGKKAGATSLLPGIGDLAAAKGGAGGLLGGLGGIGSAISAAAPYAAIAAVAIPLISSVFGSLFRRAPTGTAIMSNGVTTIGGNNADARKAVSSTADSVNGSLARVAQALGADIGGYTVSIGKRNDHYRVSGSGSSRVGEKHPNTPLLYNGTDAEEAMRIAVRDAIQDGAIQGISAASQAILKSGQDIEKAIEKALLIEDIPKRLQSKLDPVGFAIDQLNKSWEKTIKALEEGGASAEQMAAAQKLYKIELAETKAAARAASEDLRQFLNGLNFGSGSPYSTRDQERKAADALKPFEEAILRGERVDQGKYTEAAQTWLDLQRELFGSTGKFFEGMDRIQSLTGKAISDIDNAKPIRVETDPFVKSTAANTQASAELLAQISRQTAETNTLLAQLARSGGGGNFVGGDGRYFNNMAAA